jgi:glycosyltransferase involved in cell wall biosynthesis
MALRKCVIISESLGVDDVLTEGHHRPGRDAEALREAIQKAWENPALREAYAERGYQYALPLGGEDRLRQSILEALPGRL